MLEIHIHPLPCVWRICAGNEAPCTELEMLLTHLEWRLDRFAVLVTNGTYSHEELVVQHGLPRARETP